jgi:nitrile hydratase subunit beta
VEGAHDLGGLDGFGPVVTDDGDLTHHEPWELRAQGVAIFGLRGGMRRWIERLDPGVYLTSPYYARWLRAAEQAAVERGLVSEDDLDRWRSTFAADSDAIPPVVADADAASFVESVMTSADRLRPATNPRFAVGDAVAVRRWRDAANHHRCPRYVRGVTGSIESICGDEPVPGHETTDIAPLYTVAFASTDLWGAAPEPPFTVLVDLSEPYLKAAE